MLSKAKQSKAKQSKAKQSKAKLLLYLLNNFKFYISQFFNSFNFLSVFIRYAKIFSQCLENSSLRGFVKNRSNLFSVDCFIRESRTLVSFAMAVKNNFAILNLVKTILTLIKFNFDRLLMKIKNHYLVINKNLFI